MVLEVIGVIRDEFLISCQRLAVRGFGFFVPAQVAQKPTELPIGETLLDAIEGLVGKIGDQLFKKVQGAAERYFRLVVSLGSSRLIRQLPQRVSEVQICIRLVSAIVGVFP